MRLLIIEDDIELSHVMKSGLEKGGFKVDVANTGMDGEEKSFVSRYDSILLDLNLPDKDGIEILSFCGKTISILRL
ncbi:response regulator [Paenibacillus larvae]|nr:response regulator [Paenibacillus larvae]MDT2254697.1 response regulator [Paenibacillus larvae]